jgi:hypothetical protein
MLRRLECECGFAAEGGDDELVVTIQHHAREVHHLELDRARILRLATCSSPDSATPETEPTSPEGPNRTGER